MTHYSLIIRLSCRFADVKSKRLTPGAKKRLSIAEEVVHGPSLLLIDEPLVSFAYVKMASCNNLRIDYITFYFPSFAYVICL